MKRWYPFLLLFPLVTGCNCRPNVVEPIELGLRVQPTNIEFGRIREGDIGRATLTLSAETRAQVSVSLSTDAPFGVEQFVDVPGSGQTSVEVTFLAGDTEVDGTLRLVVDGKTAEVKLHGIGVRPLECRPSLECIVSVYSLEENKCIESVVVDDTPCDPASVCLEQGRCRAGQCLGIARRCDDRDACTDDACAMDIGCVHTPHACPAPTAACRVATCEPATGCGDAVAPDLTVCGPQNCTNVNICLGGACQQTPTPEGFPCAPSIACLPEAQCHNQQCTRVMQADWSVEWSARLSHEPTGELTSSGAAIFFSTCTDAGLPTDAGQPDAGVDDGGIDAGRALVCGLASYTSTGFERFVYPYEDNAPRSTLGANSAGVLLLGDGGLELRSKTNGSLRHALNVQPHRHQLVVERDRIFFWADGGVHVWLDGGTHLLQSIDEPTALGRGEALFAWNPDAGVLTRMTLETDGGFHSKTFSVSGIATSQLAVAQDRVLFGSIGNMNTSDDDDAGLIFFDWADAGVSQPLEESTLTSSASTNAFFLRCDGGCSPDDAQETWVRVFDTQTGQPRWESLVVGPSFPGTIRALTLIDGQPGAFAALVRSETPGGPRSLLALYADGERKAVCQLPPSSGAVELAHFSASALMVTVRKPDGTVALESYPLGALPVSHSTWSTPQGTFGTRSDRQ